MLASSLSLSLSLSFSLSLSLSLSLVPLLFSLILFSLFSSSLLFSVANRIRVPRALEEDHRSKRRPRFSPKFAKGGRAESGAKRKRNSKVENVTATIVFRVSSLRFFLSNAACSHLRQRTNINSSSYSRTAILLIRTISRSENRKMTRSA